MGVEQHFAAHTATPGSADTPANPADGHPLPTAPSPGGHWGHTRTRQGRGIPQQHPRRAAPALPQQHPRERVLENSAPDSAHCRVFVGFKAGTSCWRQRKDRAAGKKGDSGWDLRSGGSGWVPGCGVWLTVNHAVKLSSGNFRITNTSKGV